MRFLDYLFKSKEEREKDKRIEDVLQRTDDFIERAERMLDEITSLVVAIQRMNKYITPEMEAKVDGILDQYAEFEEVTV